MRNNAWCAGLTGAPPTPSTRTLERSRPLDAATAATRGPMLPRGGPHGDPLLLDDPQNVLRVEAALAHDETAAVRNYTKALHELDFQLKLATREHESAQHELRVIESVSRIVGV